ncbi:MAG: 3-deoxy-7-phosphoheptulonate synthase, partial [Acidimicrobiia bacterium]|nr:3-deoxy-7-phosphoheptulonate synthase [Acidimicrobiia bacterium]
DPSHSGGHRYLVAPLTRVAVVSGADGFMVDVHPAPETALVDGAQAILPDEFAELMEQVRNLAAVIGLEL